MSYVYMEDLYDELIRQVDSSLRWNDMLKHYIPIIPDQNPRCLSI